MANYTWISDIAGDWTTTANWSTDDATPTYPGAGDAAIFNGGHAGDCSVDSVISVDSVTDSGSYIGNLILSNNLSVVGASGFSWTNGELSGAGTLSVRRDCNIAGSTISTDAAQIIEILHNQSTLNTFTADQTISNLTMNAAVGGAEAYILSGTFTISGDLRIIASKVQGTSTITVNGDMHIEGPAGNNITSSTIIITVNGDLYLTDGTISSGTIKVDGDIIAADTWDGGIGIIEWQKAGDETWTPNPNVMYSTLKFTSARTVTLGGPLYCYNPYISAGATLDTNDETFRFQMFNVNNIAGTFNYGNSEFHFSPILVNGIDCNLGTLSIGTLRMTNGYSGAATHDIQGNCTIDTLIINMGSYFETSSGTPTVTNEMQLIDGRFNAGSLILTGDLVISNGYVDGGYGSIDWQQAGDITWSDTGGSAGKVPVIKFNSNRTVTLGNHLVSEGIYLQDGMLDVSASNYSIKSTRYWDASVCSAANPCLNARSGKVTINLYTSNTSIYGASDSSGCIFYDLDITGGHGASYTNFYNNWNISNDLLVNFAGDMEADGSTRFNVTGDVTVQDGGAFELRNHNGENPYWDIAGNLTMTGGKWNTRAGSFKMYVAGDVNLSNLIETASSTAYIILDGTIDQTFYADPTCKLPGYVQFDKSSGVANVTGSGDYFNNINIIDGDVFFAPGSYEFATGKTVSVAAGSSLVFNGTAPITMVTLREKDDGANTWAIDNSAGGTVEAYFSDIKSSVVSTPSALAYDSVNSGGNINWIFISPGGVTIVDNKIIDPVFVGSNIQI